MGKYIKYFENEDAFAEWLNFGEKAEGPDGAPSASVAYVGSIDTLFYDNTDVSQYELLFQPQNSEIDATAETVTFAVKTGVYWLDVYHNGEFIRTYRPTFDEDVRYDVDANMTPLTVQEVFTGMWYKDNNGEKGEFIENWDRSVTHKPDPNADPVKLTIIAGYTSDGQNPTRLGNGSLTGATRVYYEDETLGTDVDILNDIYIQDRRAWYQFSAQGEYNVYFEFESEDQTVGDYFIYSQGKYLDIYTNYPELAEQTNFRFTGPLMQSTIEKLYLGEGMLSVNGFLMANNLNYIYLEDQNKLPELNGSLTLVANEGAIFCDENAENFSMWQAGKPAGWYINSTGLGAWFGSSSTFPSSGGSDTIYFSFGLPMNEYFGLTIDSGNAHFNDQRGPTTVTGDTNSLSTGVTFYTEVNTGETYQGSITIVSYDANDNQIDSITLTYTVEGEVVPPAPTGNTVTVVGTFITTSDSQTVNVASYDGGNWSYAYIDGNRSDVLPMNTASYTFPSADTHTITYVRESSDPYLQAWFNYTDVVRIEASGSESWGCHGNDYYQSSTSMAFANNTQLTGATFDANCGRIGSSCFSGCTSLVYLAFNNPEGLTMAGEAYPFDTITANQGVLHIPSGATSTYSNIITALGNNWTVQDDL